MLIFNNSVESYGFVIRFLSLNNYLLSITFSAAQTVLQTGYTINNITLNFLFCCCCVRAILKHIDEGKKMRVCNRCVQNDPRLKVRFQLSCYYLHHGRMLKCPLGKRRRRRMRKIL